MRLLGHVVRITLLVPLVALALALLVAGWILLTETGGRWALDQVPGLRVEGFEGTLAREWRAQSLVYSDGRGTRLAVEQPHLSWRPSCLFSAALCVDNLSAGRVAIALPDTGDAESPDTDAAISLPEISTPLSVEVARLEVGTITLNESLILERIAFAGAFSGPRLTIDTLNVEREALSAGLDGTVRFEGDWPVDAGLELEYVLSGDDYPGTLVLTSGLTGTVAELAVNADLAAPWQAHLAGVVEPLKPGFPANASLTSARFQATPDLQQSLILNQVMIHAQGNLDQGWQVAGSAYLNTAPDLPLSVRGHVDTQGAVVEHINIQDEQARYLRVRDGAVSWSDGLEVSGVLDWSRFPWLRLLPDLEAPPVALERAGLDFSLSGDRYTGVLDAQLSTPGGPVGLKTDLEGDFQQIRLDALSVASADGRAFGKADIAWRDGISWNTRLELAGISPDRWVAPMHGELSGLVRSQGRSGDEGLQADGELSLAGSLRGQALWLKTAAELDGDQWRVPELEVLFGDNRLTGSAAQTDSLAARMDLDLPVLAQLWTGLSGRVTASLDATDLLREPQGSLALQGSVIGYEPAELTLESINASATLREALSGQAQILWQGLDVAGQRIDSGQVHAEGNQENHDVSVSLSHPHAKLRLSAAGGWQNGQWQGQLDGGGVQAVEQHWLMTTPASLLVDSTGSVALGSHCWGWSDAQLCTGDQRLYPEQHLELALNNFPTEVLGGGLPLDLRWRERLNGAARVSMTDAGPQGSVWLDAGTGKVSLRQIPDPDDLDAAEVDPETQERWVPLAYDAFRVEARLTPEGADLNAHLSGPDLGQARADLKVDPNKPDYPLNGEIGVEHFDLAVIRPFLDLETVEGRLRGNASLSGVLASPRVQGRIQLEEGRLLDQRLPLRFDALSLDAAFEGTQAEITGEWRSGEEGTGTLEGQASWDEGPRADLSLTGDKLPVSVEPFAQVTVFPDLRVRYGPQGLNVTGRVDVPRGSVTIESLPESATGVSEDEVIVGEEKESSGLRLGMDLVVVIGEELVSFNGFGVTGDLTGRLRLVDDMNANGELNLENGRYELYGQDLTIRRAQLLFSGPLDRPYLDIEAIRRVDEVVAGIRLTGPADEPRAEIFSEPAMSEQEALSYLVLGRPLQGEGDSYAMERAAIGLGLAQAAPVTREIGERVGIEDLQLETEGRGDETSVVASGYLTERLSVRYGVGLFDPVSRVALRYDLSRRLYLEAASGLASSLDIFYQRDFGKPGE